MSLIAILVAGAALGIVWRLVRLATRIALLIALIALLANYGSHLASGHRHTPPPSAHRAR